MTELFIYYRATVDRADALRTEALAMQARLRHRYPHLIARLLRRPEAVDGLHTWMETYTTDPMRPESGALPCEAIDTEAACLAPLIEGVRHVEVFAEVRPECAC